MSRKEEILRVSRMENGDFEAKLTGEYGVQEETVEDIIVAIRYMLTSRFGETKEV